MSENEVIAAQAHLSDARDLLDKANELLMRGSAYYDRQRAIAMTGRAHNAVDEAMRITNAELRSLRGY